MQNSACCTDGENFNKLRQNLLIDKVPQVEGYKFTNEHFRDPFVWKYDDNYFLMAGTQETETKRCVVYYINPII